MSLQAAQWRIQDFPEGGRQLPKWVCLSIIFAENCMKMKEFGPRGAPLGSANAALLRDRVLPVDVTVRRTLV